MIERGNIMTINNTIKTLLLSACLIGSSEVSAMRGSSASTAASHATADAPGGGARRPGGFPGRGGMVEGWPSRSSATAAAPGAGADTLVAAGAIELENYNPGEGDHDAHLTAQTVSGATAAASRASSVHQAHPESLERSSSIPDMTARRSSRSVQTDSNDHLNSNSENESSHHTPEVTRETHGLAESKNIASDIKKLKYHIKQLNALDKESYKNFMQDIDHVASGRLADLLALISKIKDHTNNIMSRTISAAHEEDQSLSTLRIIVSLCDNILQNEAKEVEKKSHEETKQLNQLKSDELKNNIIKIRKEKESLSKKIEEIEGRLSIEGIAQNDKQQLQMRLTSLQTDLAEQNRKYDAAIEEGETLTKKLSIEDGRSYRNEAEKEQFTKALKDMSDPSGVNRLIEGHNEDTEPTLMEKLKILETHEKALGQNLEDRIQEVKTLLAQIDRYPKSSLTSNEVNDLADLKRKLFEAQSTIDLFKGALDKNRTGVANLAATKIKNLIVKGTFKARLAKKTQQEKEKIKEWIQSLKEKIEQTALSQESKNGWIQWLSQDENQDGLYQEIEKQKETSLDQYIQDMVIDLKAAEAERKTHKSNMASSLDKIKTIKLPLVDQVDKLLKTDKEKKEEELIKIQGILEHVVNNTGKTEDEKARDKELIAEYEQNIKKVQETLAHINKIIEKWDKEIKLKWENALTDSEFKSVFSTVITHKNLRVIMKFYGAVIHFIEHSKDEDIKTVLEPQYLVKLIKHIEAFLKTNEDLNATYPHADSVLQRFSVVLKDAHNSLLPRVLNVLHLIMHAKTEDGIERATDNLKILLDLPKFKDIK